MERRWWGSWKARLAVGLVAAGLVATLLGVLLTQRTPSPVAIRARATSPLGTLTMSPSGAPAPPNLLVLPGWTQALSGLVLSDFGHFDTLVTSAAKSGRIAACALPPHPWPVMVAPQFVLSNDGGRTWEQQALPFVGAVWGCDLAGDPLDPDTYAISVIHINDGKAMEPDETVVTHDAGRTWRLEAMPGDMLYSCATLPQQLHMPTWVQAQPCVIDPLDPTHLYAIVTTSATVN